MTSLNNLPATGDWPRQLHAGGTSPSGFSGTAESCMLSQHRNPEMLLEEQMTALGDQNLINFLLRDDIPCPEILGEDNCLLEDCSMSEPELLDEEMDDLIASMLSPSGDVLEMMQEYLHDDSDSSISEYQHLLHNPGSNFDSSCQSSDNVRVDHNYSCPANRSALESMSSDIAEGDASTELGTRMDLEGTSMAAEQSSSLPIPVAVTTGPQLVPGVVAQAEEHLQKNVHQNHSARDSRGRELNMDCLANRSLLEQQQQEPQASVTESTAGTTANNSSMVLVLSINLVVTSSLLSVPNEETQAEVPVLSQQISEFPDHMVVDVKDDTMLELYFPNSEDPLMSISVTKSQEQKQSSSNLKPRSSFISNPVQAAAGSKLSPPEPQEQPFASRCADGMESQ